MYDSGGDDGILDVYSVPNDGLIMSGYATNGNSVRCGRLLRLDDDGQIIWDRQYEAEGGLRSLASVIEADNGDFLACAGIGENRDRSNRIAVMRVDSDGEEIWFRTFRRGRGTAIIELKDGRFLITSIENGDYLGVVICIDGEGELIWEREYSLGTRHHLVGLREAEDGVIVGGDVLIENVPGYQFLAFKIRSDNGEVIWWNSYRIDVSNLSMTMTSTGQGQFLIAGFTGDNRGQPEPIDMAAVLVDSNGDLMWGRRYSFANRQLWGMDQCNAAARVAEGGFILAGFFWFPRDQGDTHHPAVVRIGPNGDELWKEIYFLLPENGFGQGVGRSHSFGGVIQGSDGSLYGAGTATFERNNEGKNGLLIKLEREVIGPQFISWSPRDTTLSLLIGTRQTFAVQARNQNGAAISYLWRNAAGQVIDRDSSATIQFDELGQTRIECRVTSGEQSRVIGWNVAVMELLIVEYTPEHLSLTVQRNSEIDFALDSIAYIGDMENLRYEWMIYDSAAVRWEEVAGDDRIGIRSYAFDRTGGYALKAKVFDPNVDPVPADSVQWAIQVRGGVRAYEPNLAEISLEPRQETTFELTPFNANNDSIQFWWTLNEADTMSIESTLSISFQDTGRYIVSGYAREQVGEEEWEEDVQVWVVYVHSLSAGLDPRLRGDDEAGSGDDEGGSGDDAPLSLTIAPNPFNDKATVTVDLGGQAFLPALRADKNVRPPRAQVGGLMPVRIGLYAIDGREILRLHDGPLSPGSHTFALSHFSTFTLPSGIFFLRLQTGSHSRTVKAVLMR